jgi:hypothetical protein
MARRPSPPTARVNQIARERADGSMDWPAIQTMMEKKFEWVHGAMLIGILNAMVKRGLIVEDSDLYRLA